jgi:hypothetical protein
MRDIKNRLCGVTTVTHQIPYEADVFGPQFPVRVVPRYGGAHSLQYCPDVAAGFELRLRGRLLPTPAKAPMRARATKCNGWMKWAHWTRRT